VDVYATDEEKVEALKKWWKENATTVITGVLLALAVLFGGRAWFQYRANQSQKASNEYAQLTTAVANKKDQAALAAGEALTTHYSSSPYAVLATFALARLKIQQGELQAAQVQLKWALDHADQPQLKQIARLRLARVMLARKDYAGAEKVLSAGDPGNFKGEYAALRGDVALAQGKVQQARAAYDEALQALPAGAPGRALLQAERDNAVKADGPGKEPRS